jgi:hypothetical protein
MKLEMYTHGHRLDIDEIFILLKAYNSWHRTFQIIQKESRQISEAENIMR